MTSDDLYITSSVSLRQPKQFRWEPQPDITAYELALCVPLFVPITYPGYYVEDRIAKLPAEAQRHFVIEEPKK